MRQGVSHIVQFENPRASSYEDQTFRMYLWRMRQSLQHSISVRAWNRLSQRQLKMLGVFVSACALTSVCIMARHSIATNARSSSQHSAIWRSTPGRTHKNAHTNVQKMLAEKPSQRHITWRPIYERTQERSRILAKRRNAVNRSAHRTVWSHTRRLIRGRATIN